MELIEQEDVEFIRLQFTDICGSLKNIAVTKEQLDRVLTHNCVFDGSALYGDGRSGFEDMYLVPDPETFVILPWRPQQGKVARFLCDVYTEEGALCMDSPRAILKKVLEDAKDKGYSFDVDPECEFFLFHTDENGIPTTVTHDYAGYMDVGPLDLGENARRDIVFALEEMGFSVESSHHEKAPAQQEIDFKESEAMTCADAIVTFRSAVRSIAKRFGMHATFMPKPKAGDPGSGMHMNISVYKDDRNIFNCPDKTQVRDEARWFMGGIMKHARALCLVTNPLVNSYKRLSFGFEAPKDIVWSVQKVNSLVRVRRPLGEDTKVELRFPDSSANPYLAIAACVAAGLEGIEKRIEPVCFAPDCYEKGEKVDSLPATLLEAVEAFKKDELMVQIFGEEFCNVYTDMKLEEWKDYMLQVSDWELNRYLYRL